MNINITAVTPSKATVNGQPMAREYVETLLLPLTPVAGHSSNTVFLFALCAIDQSPSWGLCAGPWERTQRANKRKT